MGAACGRLDCSGVVEDCASTVRGHSQNSLWYDCAGYPLGPASCSSNNQGESETSPEVITEPQEPGVQFTASKFAIRRVEPPGASNGAAGSSSWNRRYALGRELGAGQTAVVFEAVATVPETDDPPGMNPSDRPSQQMVGPGRRVALKRFNSPGTAMFRQEVLALNAVGVHPHVLRLLESFEGGGQDDVLVLEYCEGGDVYDLYAANRGYGMLEAFVVHLVWQLLQALEHLVCCGVEHRDVKPENLLLFGSSVDSPYPSLKLADFGWAVVTSSSSTRNNSVPPEGVGSLWYAPPELNPPVKGAEALRGTLPESGQSDMWSVGIVTYLLLVGHSPFNQALRISDAHAREHEVIRLAAWGEINRQTRAWQGLSADAQSFVAALIQPVASRRMTAAEAQRHPFIMRGKGSAPQAPPPQVAQPVDVKDGSDSRWYSQLDGLQRLGWLAVARAATEPELLEVKALRAVAQKRQGTLGGGAAYLEELAAELATAAKPSWFQPHAAWSGMLHLAFHYLDVDADGCLGQEDLMVHVIGLDFEPAGEVARAWVQRWQRMQDWRGLNFADFRRALWISCLRRNPWTDETDSHVLDEDMAQFQRWLAATSNPARAEHLPAMGAPPPIPAPLGGS